MTADLATRLHNVAVWHSEKADKAKDQRDQERHHEISERAFIRSYWLKRSA